MKQSYLFAILGVIIVGVILLFLLTQKTPLSSTNEEQALKQQPTEQNAADENKPFSGKDTFANLLKRNVPLECTYSFDDQGKRTEGTVFVSGTKSRIESMYQDSDGVTFSSSIINDSSTMHMWGTSEEGQMAIQMKVPEAKAGVATEPSTPASNTLDLNTAVFYSCNPWRVDASVFVPPSNIQFMDMDQMMQEMGEMMGGSKGDTLPADIAQ